MTRVTSQSRQVWRAIFALLAVLVFGCIMTNILVEHGEKGARDGLMSLALTVAAVIPPDRVASLSGSSDDLGTPVFEELRTGLVSIRDANEGVRFIYLMAMKDGNVVFLADAEPPDSEDYSAPGDVYDDSSQELLDAFTNGQPFVEGPIEDEWGEWVSSLAPIRDPKTGSVIALVGFDMNADAWRARMAIYRWLGLSLTVFPLLLALTLIIHMRRVSQMDALLFEEIQEKALIGQKLQVAVEEVKALEGIVTICSRCKKVREDDGSWLDMTLYVRDHTEVDFSHGFCPDCYKIELQELHSIEDVKDSA